jgi:preprotein translocase subunit YajC
VGGSNGSFGTVLLVAALGLLLLTFLRTRRAQREAVTTRNRLEPGSEIMTTSGLFATVVSVDDDVMTLETGPGQLSRWDKRAVARILPPGTTRTVQSDDDAAENPSGSGHEATADDENPPGRE